MASVFLSYDREDVEKARPIAVALERGGHSVWWDQQIRGGAQFSKEIEQALASAEAVVVLWSRESIESHWVRDEAAAGRDRGCLVPARIERVEPPLGFRQYLTLDLFSWRGRPRASQLTALLRAIDSLALSKEPAPTPPARPSDSPRRNWKWLAAVAAGALAVAGLVYWRPWASRAGPLVAVTPANTSAEAAALSQDLLVQLGKFQASRPEALQLTDSSAGKRADLIVEVGGNTSASPPSASLALLRGKDRMLLASHEVAGEQIGADALKQSFALSAARLLGCAADTLQARPQLAAATLKLYVAACSRFGGLYGSDDISLILPQLQQVTEREPDFRSAWRLLLLGGASLLAFPSDQPKPSRQWLKTQIDRARHAGANKAEIGIAELELLPANAFAARLNKIGEIAAEAPEDPAVLDVHAEQLQSVGRLTEALGLAERASLLDPISPAARAAYIRALSYSGRIPSAMEKLTEAGPLMIGSKNLLEARFRVNMRYGNAGDALQLLRRYGTSKSHEAFLLARIDPTPANIEQALSVSRSVSDQLKLFGGYAEVATAFGRSDQLYDTLMSLRRDQVDQSLLSILFRPTLKPLRQDPRFLHIAQRFGLLDYWRSSGKWPDFCSDPDLPYDCKKEAARLAA